PAPLPSLIPLHPLATPFPYTPLFRSHRGVDGVAARLQDLEPDPARERMTGYHHGPWAGHGNALASEGPGLGDDRPAGDDHPRDRSEEHTSELQSRVDLVCRLLLEKKK